MTATGMTAPVLEAESLRLPLAGRPAVDGVSLRFAPGQWAAVVGPNGAGKSTLLRLLAGLLKPEQGLVRLQGRPLAEWPARERAQRLGWLAQQGETEAELSVQSLVALGRLPHQGLLGAPSAHDADVLARVMAETETLELAARRVSALSGGERQRALLARVLAVEAPVLLLDEPMAHLDPPHQRALLRSLRTRAAQGHTVLAVLHDLNLALTADRVVLMARGQVVADGEPGDATLRDALVAVFGHSFSIEAVQREGQRRWIAVPTL
jgi:iron complex transport system ATP-binding protein